MCGSANKNRELGDRTARECLKAATRRVWSELHDSTFPCWMHLLRNIRMYIVQLCSDYTKYPVDLCAKPAAGPFLGQLQPVGPCTEIVHVPDMLAHKVAIL